MDRSIAPLQEDRLPARNRQDAAMTACRIAGITVGAVLFAIVLSQVPDIIRYIRMTRM
jgi:tetrahydromethanopterin S-methyltransferase subunit F